MLPAENGPHTKVTGRFLKSRSRSCEHMASHKLQYFSDWRFTLLKSAGLQGVSPLLCKVPVTNYHHYCSDRGTLALLKKPPTRVPHRVQRHHGKSVLKGENSRDRSSGAGNAGRGVKDPGWGPQRATHSSFDHTLYPSKKWNSM